MARSHSLEILGWNCVCAKQILDSGSAFRICTKSQLVAVNDILRRPLMSIVAMELTFSIEMYTREFVDYVQLQ